MSCPICTENYTKVIRRPVECYFCEKSACCVCTKMYLKEQFGNWKCMYCQKKWTAGFVNMNIKMSKELIDQRKDYLFRAEESFIPNTQKYIHFYEEIDRYNKNEKELNNKFDELIRTVKKIINVKEC